MHRRLSPEAEIAGHCGFTLLLLLPGVAGAATIAGDVPSHHSHCRYVGYGKKSVNG